MDLLQDRYVFDYRGKEVSSFRLCVDRYGDKSKRIYRLYCPYVTGCWEFGTIARLTESLMATNAAMQRGDAAEGIFSVERGTKDIVLKCSPEIWSKNMLHTKRGSFYSAYLGFWMKDDADNSGFITVIDSENAPRRTTINEQFHTADELGAFLAEVERVYTEGHNTLERQKLFRKYVQQKEKTAKAPGQTEDSKLLNDEGGE